MAIRRWRGAIGVTRLMGRAMQARKSIVSAGEGAGLKGEEREDDEERRRLVCGLVSVWSAAAEKRAEAVCWSEWRWRSAVQRSPRSERLE